MTLCRRNQTEIRVKLFIRLFLSLSTRKLRELSLSLVVRGDDAAMIIWLRTFFFSALNKFEN